MARTASQLRFDTFADFPQPGGSGTLYIATDTNTIYYWDGSMYVSLGGGGGGAVDSVNGQTGVVVLDTDDISDTATNRYTNDTDIARLANTSGTNTGDQVGDGVTITGTGTPGNPFVAVSGGSGDVTGPGSSTDNAVARFDGTTGKIIQNSAVTIADTSGNITGGTYNGNTIGAGSTSGSNTGDQTSVSGNAGTATALQTARTIGTATGDVTSAGSSFDGTANNTNALTLATVNSNVGSFGSSTSIPTFTVNGKGLITAASGNVVVAPAGTLSGTTLNSSVVTSSLTSVGSQAQALDMGSHKINNVTDPTAAQDAATKNYVDNIATGLTWKNAVRVATTTNGALATAYENGDTIDGIVLATGDRILIKNQTTQTENGIYVVAASGTPTRSTDADTGTELISATVLVREGTGNADTQWTCTNDTITIGVTNIVFAQIAGAGTYTAGTGLTLTANAFSVNTSQNIATLSNLTTNGLVTTSGGAGTLSVTAPGTGVLTALGVNVGTAGAVVVNGGALGTPSSGVATNLTGTASGLTAGNVTTNANLTGDVTSVGNVTTLTNAPVIAKVLTGYTSGAGTVAATDSILQAIQKLNGNDATNANLTGPITSVGNATSIASQTGTGTKFVVDTSPTLVTPNIGVATATSVNKVALTAPATGSTLTIIDGKTLTVNKTISLTAADDTGVYTLPTGTKTLLATDGSAASLTSFPTLNQNTTGTANIAGGTLGAIPYQSGAGATTVLAATATANKILLSGASAAPVWSTPTFPNASATSGKMIKSDGTNWVASTETYAAPGTSGNVMTSDGTNWTSSAPAGGTPKTIISTDYANSTRYAASTGSGGTATFDDNPGGVRIATSTTAGGRCGVFWGQLGGKASDITGTIFTAQFQLVSNGSDYDFYHGFGDLSLAGAGLTFTNNHVGFKVTRTGSGTVTLSATNANGTTETATSLATLSVNDVCEVMAVVNSTSSISYYYRVNGAALSAATTHTTNIGASSEVLNTYCQITNRNASSNAQFGIIGTTIQR